jgi:hypothetical protein
MVVARFFSTAPRGTTPLTHRPLLLLFLGLLPFVAGAIVLSRWATADGDLGTRSSDIGVGMAENTRDDKAGASKSSRDEAMSSLQTACREAAVDIARRLGTGCAVIVRSPFVVAGDLDLDELVRWHEETIGPAARAMAHSYFKASPHEPITVLLFSDRAAYDWHAEMLYGDEGISVYGYYKPDERTLVMNIGTGGGTLVHELTHALIDFDFPDVPDWFNEGLASLHEQCRIRRDKLGIDGLVNWRLPGLQRTIRAGRLRSLEALIRDENFRGSEVGLNYAHARYFCLFLQSDQNPRGRSVLGEFYAELRAQQPNDPQGLVVVRRVFPDHSWAQLDAGFRDFVLSLKP